MQSLLGAISILVVACTELITQRSYRLLDLEKFTCDFFSAEYYR